MGGVYLPEFENKKESNKELVDAYKTGSDKKENVLSRHASTFSS